MANFNPKTEHLTETQWKPGESGNPKGRPVGSKNLSTWIQFLLFNEDENGMSDLSVSGAPVEAIIIAMIKKAQDGDVRAFEVLARHGFGTKLTLQQLEPPRPILGGRSIASED